MEGEISSAQKLHTAEHIFARCLQNQGVSLKVRKVDTERSDGIGEAFFEGTMPLEKLLSAEQATNRIICQGLDVKSEEFGTVEEAKERFPELRFNEEMLSGVKGITVVKIGDFDFAACAKKHACNTSQIVSFAISSVTYPSGETKMMFRAGQDAVEYSLGVKGRVLGIASSDNFEAERIGERYSALKQSLQGLSEDNSGIIEAALRSIAKPVIYVKVSNLNLFYKQANEYVEKMPDKYFIVFNDKQLLGLKGSGCAADMAKIGNDLKGIGAFVGAVKADSISGKVLDLEKVQDYFCKF